jgi:hypothetical protein
VSPDTCCATDLAGCGNSRYIPAMDEDVRTIQTETAMAAMVGMLMRMPSPVGRCLREI